MKQRKPYTTYTKEFKQEAVRLMETSDRPAAEIAMEARLILPNVAIHISSRSHHQILNKKYPTLSSRVLRRLLPGNGWPISAANVVDLTYIYLQGCNVCQKCRSNFRSHGGEEDQKKVQWTFFPTNVWSRPSDRPGLFRP